MCPWTFSLFLCPFGTEEALDHLASFLSSREMISRLGIEPPSTPFGLSTFPLSSGNLGSSWTNILGQNVTILREQDVSRASGEWKNNRKNVYGTFTFTLEYRQNESWIHY